MKKKDYLRIEEFTRFKYVKMLGRSKRIRRIPEKRYQIGSFIYPTKESAERELKSMKQYRKENRRLNPIRKKPVKKKPMSFELNDWFGL